MEKLNVLYKGMVVGYLAKFNNKYAFEYSDEWLNSGFPISPISLPMKSGVFVPNKNIFNGFFGVFSDSLPDGWGNYLLDKYMKQHNISPENGLTKLSIVGKTGMGALEYYPNIEMIEQMNFDLNEYQLEVDKIFNKENADIDYLYKYGGSSGGARPKVLVKIDGVDWLVKFESKYDFENFGLCEYEYALACNEIGIDIPNVKLFDSKYNEGYFGIERFDRKNEEKIHMISVAALLEADFRSPCIDYNDLFKLTKILTNDNRHDIENMFLRMCFNVYAHNLDDHTKNFSFIYDEKTKMYRLSPAYDINYSNTYYGEHTTSINGKGVNITDDDLLIVGKKAKLDNLFMKNSMEKIKTIVNERLEKYLK